MSAPLPSPSQAPSQAHLKAIRAHRRVALAVLLGPWLALPLLAGLGPAAFAPRDAAIALVMYLLGMLGITAGYHRLFTHRAFQAPGAVRLALGVMGGMAMQGPLLYWVSTHRKHHQFADKPGDPHSPWVLEHETLRGLRGAWHAQVGWMLRAPAMDWARLVPDLLRDDAAFWLNRHYFAWAALGLILPGLAGGLLSGSWQGALTGALWGGPVRVLLGHHATWSINSVCHLWGERRFETHDHSANHPIAALLTLGEGWHNNHHAFPASARHGLGWAQPDPTYWLIALFARVGLASGLVLPERELTRTIPAAPAAPPAGEAAPSVPTPQPEEAP